MNFCTYNNLTMLFCLSLGLFVSHVYIPMLKISFKLIQQFSLLWDIHLISVVASILIWPLKNFANRHVVFFESEFPFANSFHLSLSSGFSPSLSTVHIPHWLPMCSCTPQVVSSLNHSSSFMVQSSVRLESSLPYVPMPSLLVLPVYTK